VEIKIIERILAANENAAAENRELLDHNHVPALNVMGSPGAGKTSLIERTIALLRDRAPVAVIEGDIATTRDAERVAKLGAPVVQIATGGECHLDAAMVGEALANLDLHSAGVVIIENVGNLVCPAEFDLGEHRKVVVASLPEGDDKIEKYPLIFSIADAVVLNKTDMAGLVDFDIKRFRSELDAINPKAAFFEVSCRTWHGLDEWAEWVAPRAVA